MKTHIPTRIVVAAEQLAVQADNHILVIGCGNGLAAALVCAYLASGRLVAIDRSATQISRAGQRNQAYVQSGTLVLHTMHSSRQGWTRRNLTRSLPST